VDFSIVTQLTWAAYYGSLLLLGLGAGAVLLAAGQHSRAAVLERLAYLLAVLAALALAYFFVLTYALIDRAPGAASTAEAAQLAAWVRQTSQQHLLMALGGWLLLLTGNWLFQRLALPRVADRHLVALGGLLLLILLSGILLDALNGYYGLLEEYQRSRP